MSKVLKCLKVAFVMVWVLFSAASRSDSSPTFTVHFTVPPNVGGPVIDVQFSNGYSGRFLLDTATTHTVITEDVAAKLHLMPHPLNTDDGKPFIFGGVRAQGIEAHDMKIGEFTIANFSLIVLNKTTMPSPVDGIIGINFFAKFSTFLDCGTRTAMFWYNGSPSADERSALGLSGAVALPLISDPSPFFNVHVTYNNSKEENLILDSGAVETRISWSIAQDLKLHPLEDAEHHHTAEGTLTFSEAVLDRLEAGDLVLKDPRVLYVTDTGTVKRVGYPPCIANDVLSHCRFLIDTPNHLLYIKPLDKTPTGKTPEAGKTTIDMAAIVSTKIPAFTVALSRDAALNLPVIDVTLGGRYVGKFLIDSGTPITLVTDSVAAVLRLNPFPTPTSDGKPLVFLNKPTQCVDVPGVKIGDQDLGDQLFVLVKHTDLPIDVDGILGCNFLSVFSTLLDFGSRTATLWYNSSPSPGELAAHGMTGAVTVPATMAEPYAFKIKARYNNSIEDEVVVDTGAEFSQISLGIVKLLKLQPTHSGGRAQVFGGTTQVNSAVVHQFEIGSILVKDLSVQYAPENGPKTVKQCVGMDVLSHYKVLIDAPNKLIYFKSIDAGSAAKH